MMEFGVSATADWSGTGLAQRQSASPPDGGHLRLVARRIEAGEQRRIAAHLVHALEFGLLQVQFHPRVALASGGIIGVEARLTMPHRRRGIVPLDDMIKLLASKGQGSRQPSATSSPLPDAANAAPTAVHGHATLSVEGPASITSASARFGLAERINDFLFHQACAEAMTWPTAWSLALNIGIHHAATPQFVAAVDRELTASKLAPQRLELEIAEAELIEAGASIREELAALHRLGVGIVLDDFGHSYASLGLMRRMKLAAVKLDRSLTRSLAASPADRALLAAAAEIGHGLGIRIAADGVETREQFDLLCAAGCDQAQGSWFDQTIQTPGGIMPAS